MDMNKAGERVWTVSGQGETYSCELCDRGRWGVEANIMFNGHLLVGQRFDSRESALAWACEEQVDMEHRHARMH